MSDPGPPAEPSDLEPAAEPQGFAALPRWAKVLIPIAGVLSIVLVGVVVRQAVGDDDGTIEEALEELADAEQGATTSVPASLTATSETPPITAGATTQPPPTTVAATTSEAAPTTDAATTTEAASTTVAATTTEAPPTTVAATTTTEAASTTVAATTTEAPSTTVAATTTEAAPTTVAATTTEAPPTTDAATTTEASPTTDPATTTDASPTTDPATTTEVPPTTQGVTTESAPTSEPVLRIAPGAIAASASVFAQEWNANAAGTNVPALTEAEVTALENGPTATTFIAPLSDHVGLVGVVRKDDRSVAKALLVWIPGGDQAASNQLYRDAFDVLLRTVNPDLTRDARARVGNELGLSALAPPFAVGETATAEESPNRLTRYVRATSVSDDTSVVSVVDARPR